MGLVQLPVPHVISLVLLLSWWNRGSILSVVIKAGIELRCTENCNVLEKVSETVLHQPELTSVVKW